MAQQFVAEISSLFSSKPTGPVDTPFECFNLTRKCLERVQKMAFSSASSLKFNHTQCRYLAGKLSLAVKNANHILEAFNIVEKEIHIVEAFNREQGQFYQIDIKDQDNTMADCLDLLYALAMEVEDIIRSCSGDAWTLAAVTLLDVSEHVSAIGFDLELWNVVSHGSKTPADVESIFQAEVAAVKGQASVDKEMLRRDIHPQLERAKLTSTESEQASLLLERLERSRLASTGDLAETPQSSLSEKVMKSMKQMERLGKGAAGTVFKAEWLGAEFAKKTFYGPSFPDFEKEVAILTRLSHPNIASLLCYAKEKRECSIVMELMDGDLFSLMQERLKADEARVSPFGILEAVDIMHQIGEGMRYMHDMRIVHRDLKSLNVLVKCVKALESKVEYVQVKVADFGMSRTKERSMTYSNQSANVGTTRWMAPELIRCLDSGGHVDDKNLIVHYPFKCDVYSFGMVCYEILSGDIPFSSISSPTVVKNMVMKGEHPKLPSECHELLKNLIERCWSLDASQRPSFGDICTDLRFLKFVLRSTIPCALMNIRRPLLITSSNAFGSHLGARSGQPILNSSLRGSSSIEKAMIFSKEITFSMLAFLKSKIDASINCRLLEDLNMVWVLELGQNVVIKCTPKSPDFFGVLPMYTELEALGSSMDKNLVQLMAYICITDYHVMVYEYIPGCTLKEALVRVADRRLTLSWPSRYRILCDVARGLEYLHTGVSPFSSIVHCHLSPTNILLTEEYKAMISNVGFAVTAYHDTAAAEVFHNAVGGTVGYKAPECSEKGFSSKSDVFSYGVVMAQLVTGRDPLDRFLVHHWPRGGIARWLHVCVESGMNATAAIDPTLRNSGYDAEILLAMKIAVLCMHQDPEQRPECSEVFARLRHVRIPVLADVHVEDSALSVVRDGEFLSALDFSSSSALIENQQSRPEEETHGPVLDVNDDSRV